MNISELMRDLADEAPELNVADAALRAARRHRPRAALAAVAAVLAVLAVAGTATLLADHLGRHHAPSPVEVAAPDLPASLVVPATLDPLPDGRPVGRGVLMYYGARGMVLLTTSGRQYQLSEHGGLCDSLSPGGRWLSYGTSDSAVTCSLRDLTSTTTRPDGTGSPVAWSANGRWLVADQPSEAPSTELGPSYRLVDLTTGEQRIVSTPLKGASVAAVDGAGRPVFTWTTGKAEPYTWHAGTVDPATGRLVHQAVLPLSPYLPVKAGQSTAGAFPAQLATDSGVLIARELVEPANDTLPQTTGDVLALDLSTGAVRQRYRLGSGAEEADLALGAAYPGVALLFHRGTAGRSDAIYTLDLRTGTLRRTTEIPDTVRSVGLPGQVDRLIAA